jgi:hypothetical protein
VNQVQAHEAVIGLLLQGIEREPASEFNAGLLVVAGGLVPGRKSIEEDLQARAPATLLHLDPFVKGSFFARPEAIEEGTANLGNGPLELSDERSALLI